MKDYSLQQNPDGFRIPRLDLIAFVCAFGFGLAIYLALHFLVRVPQWVMTTSLVGVMILYAVFVSAVPRLRVRLDQAGDNAYYLGLLFTLISMALALYEFARQSGSGVVDDARIGAIVGDFGVALATTITGIFLRIVLHQMRIDPADVESMTRVELSEASKHVLATLQNVTGGFGLFHDEIRQRTTDVLNKMMNDVAQASAVLHGDVAKSTQSMLGAVGGVHERVLQQTAELTRRIEEVATEAVAAIGRLKEVQPPPLTLSRRLDTIAKVLETTGTNVERVAATLDESATSASKAMGAIVKAGAALTISADAIAESQKGAAASVAASVDEVSKALSAVGQKLIEEQGLLAELSKHSRRAAEDSLGAREAAVEMLKALTAISQGLAQTINSATPKGADGSTS